VLTVKSGLDFFGIRWLWFGRVVPLVREWLVGLDGIRVLVQMVLEEKEDLT
jgi:hypothetical protein